MRDLGRNSEIRAIIRVCTLFGFIFASSAVSAADSTFPIDVTAVAGELTQAFERDAGLKLPSGQKIVIKWGGDVNVILLSKEKTEPSTVAFTWRTLSQIKDITKLKILQSTSVANFLIIISNDVDSDKELYKNLLLKDWFKDETAYEEFFADITQANLPGARKYSVSNFGRIASYLLVLSTRGCLSEEGLKTCLHSGILNGFGLAGVSISNTHLSPEEASGDLNETDKNLVKILYDERIKPTPRATRP